MSLSLLLRALDIFYERRTLLYIIIRKEREILITIRNSVIKVEEGLESLRNQLEEQLARSAKFIRNGKEHLGKMHEAISDEFNHHMSSIEDLAHKIKPKN